MPTSSLTVGQKLYYVPRRNQQPYEVTVFKVGTKWARVDRASSDDTGPLWARRTWDELKIDVKTLSVDCGKYSSSGRCYLSKECYETEQLIYTKLRVLSDKIRYKSPDEITLQDLDEAARILKIDLP